MPTKATMGSRTERSSGHIGIENGPDSYGRQQLRIFRNGGNPDGATPRGRWRPEGCKALFGARNERGREWPRDDVSPGISPGKLRASSRGNT